MKPIGKRRLKKKYLRILTFIEWSLTMLVFTYIGAVLLLWALGFNM